MPPAQRPPPIPQTAPPPSSGLRSTISFLIFLHFFFLLVGIKGSTGTPSGLDQDLRSKVPGLRPYLQTLAMDLSYMVHLTYYDPEDPNEWANDFSQFRPEDTDFVVEVDVPQDDGGSQTIQWPRDPYTKGLMGQARWQSLVSLVVINSESDDDLAPFLSDGIARRIMAETKCQEASKKRPMLVRFRRRLLQNLIPRPEVTWDDLKAEYQRDPRDPSYLQTSLELTAFMTDANEFRSTTKKPEFNTAAPADAPRQGTRPTGTPTPTNNSGTGANS